MVEGSVFSGVLAAKLKASSMELIVDKLLLTSDPESVSNSKVLKLLSLKEVTQL